MNPLVSQTILRAIFCIGFAWVIGREFGAEWLSAALGLVAFIWWVLKPYSHFKQWVESGVLGGVPQNNYFWDLVQYPVVNTLKQLYSQRDQLRADVDFFKDSFQAIGSAVIVTDGSGRILWCNQNANQLLGIELGRDEGQYLTSLLRVPSFIEYLDAELFEVPLVIVSPTNPDLHLEVRATKYRNSDTILFIRDASESVQLELMRQDFIANISHELRTPLTVITGYLDTLKDSADSLPPIWGETFDKMLSQSQRIDNMVNDLIWLSRLESVPVERDEAQVDIGKLLEAILGEARVSAPKKRFSLYYCKPTFRKGRVVPPDANDSNEEYVEHCVQGVYAELRSAVSNLVQNAIKYTDDGKHISAYCYAESDELYVSIADEGVGIEPIHIPRLTERFYRADESRTAATGGTGLGLAIVKHIMVRHKGRLVIQSDVGKGSIFSCIFPVSG